MTTLVCVMGVNHRSGEYQFGDTLVSSAVPLTALIKIFRPDRVVALCTPQAEEETIALARDELSDFTNFPTERLVVGRVALSQDPSSFAALLNTIAALDIEGDVHLDITYGPRSLAIYSLLVGGVVESLGKWSIVRLTYVNIDARPREDPSPVPIVDITSHLYLPELARSIRELERRGNIGTFFRAALRVLGDDLEVGIQNDLQQLEQDIEFLRIKSIATGRGRTAIAHLIGSLRKLGPRDSIFAEMAGRAESILNGLRPQDGEQPGSVPHLAQIVRWYAKHDRPERALLLLCELMQYTAHVPLVSSTYPSSVRQESVKYFDHAIQATEGSPRNGLLRDLKGLWSEAKSRRDDFAHASLINATNTVISPSLISDYITRFESLAKRLT
jgi:hypothetical protein